MGNEIYLSVVEADWHIEVSRKCITQQKALVEAMKCEKRDASGCQELVALSEGMLRLMLACRKLPAEQWRSDDELGWFNQAASSATRSALYGSKRV